jgi:hypothetical protein
VRGRLAKHERVLVWASCADTGEVIVTDLGLWLPQRPARLDWHRIHKATWSGARLTVIPSVQVGDGDGYTVMADGAAIAVDLAQPGDVPAQVRRRVNASVAHTEHHPLSGSGGVRVVARRVPRVDGLTWHVRYDDGTDPHDPVVITTTAALVAAAKGVRHET